MTLGRPSQRWLQISAAGVLEAIGRMQGTLEINRQSDGYEVCLNVADDTGKPIRSSRHFHGELLMAWVRARSVVDVERLESFGTTRTTVGPQPVRGNRCPTIGDLLLPFLLTTSADVRLYPFQRQGCDWLAATRRGILADDMGLGKTVQVLAAMGRVLPARLDSQALIVAPKTLVETWIRESACWAPMLVVRTLSEIGNGSLPGGANVVVCSYEELIRSQRVQSAFWRVVVADEAHRLRKCESERAKSFRSLRSDFCWLLSGTPIEHSPEDLAVLLSYLDPERFSSRNLLSAPEAIRPTAAPFLLRRRKAQVLKDLPSAHRIDVELPLTPEQSRRYFDVMLGRDAVKRIHLQRLATCRSICDMDEESESSSKLDWLKSFIETNLLPEEKVVVFSAYLPLLRAAMRRLQRWRPGIALCITGETPAAERQEAVSMFQSEASARVLLISMGVGAEGLTLTRANHVVFLNEWWNPSLNQQARDRVIRIGQHREVKEYRLITVDTIEQRIRDIVNRKQCTFEQIVDALAGRALCPAALTD